MYLLSLYPFLLHIWISRGSSLYRCLGNIQDSNISTGNQILSRKILATTKSMRQDKHVWVQSSFKEEMAYFHILYGCLYIYVLVVNVWYNIRLESVISKLENSPRRLNNAFKELKMKNLVQQLWISYWTIVYWKWHDIVVFIFWRKFLRRLTYDRNNWSLFRSESQ